MYNNFNRHVMKQKPETVSYQVSTSCKITTSKQKSEDNVISKPYGAESLLPVLLHHIRSCLYQSVAWKSRALTAAKSGDQNIPRSKLHNLSRMRGLRLMIRIYKFQGAALMQISAYRDYGYSDSVSDSSLPWQKHCSHPDLHCSLVLL